MSAYITPILKKADLNPTDPCSFRPISNLSIIFKLLEQLVCRQLVHYLSSNGLLPDLQSAYIPHRSTETAILRILSDILLALDSGNIAILSLLDLSAAFDSVDHDTLLTRLPSYLWMHWCRTKLVSILSYLSHTICSLLII